MPAELKEATRLAMHSQAPVSPLEEQQRRRMLLALGVLAVALIVVLIKDRQFWFPPAPAVELSSAQPKAPEANLTVKPASAPATPAAVTTRITEAAHAPAKNKRERVKREEPVAAPKTDSGAPQITATNRTVLPPLEVEVVAGNQHRTLAANSNPVKVEMQPSSSAATDQSPAQEPATAPPVSSTAQVSMPPGTARRVARSVEPDYPTLAKQMKVQGAVVLQALIDKAGNIQDLHVVSGPAILAAAAQEAVKQWHFKPYLQRGKAVETESRITVNFTISTY